MERTAWLLNSNASQHTVLYALLRFEMPMRESPQKHVGMLLEAQKLLACIAMLSASRSAHVCFGRDAAKPTAGRVQEQR